MGNGLDASDGGGRATGRGFATKGQLTQTLPILAFVPGVPIAQVTVDEAYGDDERLRRWLAEHIALLVHASDVDHGEVDSHLDAAGED